MSENFQQGPTQQGGSPQPQISVPQKIQSKKPKNLIIAGVSILILCLCSSACVALIGFGLYRINSEKQPVESVLNDYMRYMVNKDAENAYELFSPRAKRQIPISKIQDMLTGNNYFLFIGYQNLSVTNIKINAVANTNPDVPQGVVANVNGVINYDGSIQGSFSGTLEKVDNQWMIDAIFITVPPDKIK